ncbi:MAG: hypothetical protein HY537_07075 [Deltaproteobacteria bacterium]|nr:hypothetical protein [Deltaproteobacteria bacterium]
MLNRGKGLHSFFASRIFSYLLVALILVACGDDNSKSNPNADSPKNPNPTQTPKNGGPTLEDLVKEESRILDITGIRIGSYKDYSSYNYDQHTIYVRHDYEKTKSLLKTNPLITNMEISEELKKYVKLAQDFVNATNLPSDNINRRIVEKKIQLVNETQKQLRYTPYDVNSFQVLKTQLLNGDEKLEKAGIRYVLSVKEKIDPYKPYSYSYSSTFIYSVELDADYFRAMRNGTSDDEKIRVLKDYAQDLEKLLALCQEEGLYFPLFKSKLTLIHKLLSLLGAS